MTGQAAVLAAQDLSVLTGDPSNGLIAVLDVGGRSAQCSIVDAGIQVTTIISWESSIMSAKPSTISLRREPRYAVLIFEEDVAAGNICAIVPSMQRNWRVHEICLYSFACRDFKPFSSTVPRINHRFVIEGDFISLARHSDRFKRSLAEVNATASFVVSRVWYDRPDCLVPCAG